MENKKHIVIFSHGFGVRKDDRGILSDIAHFLPEVESILFDYFIIDEENMTLTVCPFSVQVEILSKVIKEARMANPDAIIDLVCHSQGTVVAGLLQSEEIRKTIFLAPVFDLGLERTLKRYSSKPDTEINLEGMSTLYRLDGYVRFVPAEYWAERKEIKLIEEYNVLAEKTELIVIEANQDTILEKVDISSLSAKARLLSIDGNHEFGGENRKPLLELVRSLVI